jgi:hypothetical protein
MTSAERQQRYRKRLRALRKAYYSSSGFQGWETPTILGVRLETIDRCQTIMAHLQAAVGDAQKHQLTLIDAEAERQRRPN